MSEKTEQPTPQKIRKAREDGQVAHSKDLTQTVLVVALFGYMLGNAEAIVRAMAGMILLPREVLGMEFHAAVNALGTQLLRESLWLLAPFLGIVIALGLFTELAQTGMNFSFKAMMPSGKKLDVIANVKNMFGAKGFFEFLKSNVKIALLSVVLYVLLRNSLPTLVTLPGGGMTAVAVAAGVLLKNMILYVSVGYVVIAAADFIWQRRRYTKDLMMSKDEVIKEYKEAEGDPHIKHKRKELHQELMEGGEVNSAANASVVVTNPTHYAVALQYTRDITPLPVVLAMGADAKAHRIVAVARHAGVPVLRDVPLARALVATAQLNQYIPSDLIEPVAHVLRLVQDMQNDATHQEH
ncbi:type III secretion system export apparatus subunit SctU [Diaphorobacter nitroreducens]|uniref:type III secretion system export apparatus subunit SctU n=1 Tax=Diaphorobacter nitroreducens TaxID=164759 RepID=UPI0035B1297E